MLTSVAPPTARHEPSALRSKRWSVAVTALHEADRTRMSCRVSRGTGDFSPSRIGAETGCAPGAGAGSPPHATAAIDTTARHAPNFRTRSVYHASKRANKKPRAFDEDTSPLERRFPESARRGYDAFED